MAYKALYRKWRPEVFEEVIGQTHIIRTLKNQVETDSISHAYLFSGIRGTGKTSTAKIFARAVNCLDPHGGDPCNRCEVCRSILSEQMMDVLEIDAASNNGVDHIREIRENVKYPPVKGRFKVYIIDEVHMLSAGAFNALLKTLEEPPDHVVFILATTELHKIPATVLSRCLRFTFKPLGLEEIRQRLLTICRSLDVAYEEAALTTIALNGEGALRDSLSILDQCLAYHPGELRYEQVIEVLGSINEKLLFQVAEEIAQKNSLAVLRQVQTLYLEGKDLRQLVTDLMKHYRWLLMASLDAPVEGWESLPEAARIQYREQSRLYSTGRISDIIRQLAETEYMMKRSTQPQLMLENSLMTLCEGVETSGPEAVLTDRTEDLQELAARIGRIEAFLTRLSNRKAHQTTAGKKEQAAATSAAEAERPPRENLPREDAVNQAAPDNQAIPDNQVTAAKQEGLPQKTSHETSEAASEPAGCGLGQETPLTLETIQSLWEDILEQMRKDKKISIQAMAREARLAALENCQLTLTFLPEQTILCERLGREDIRDYLATLIQKKTGRRLRLKLEVMPSEEKDPRQSLADRLRQGVPEELLEIEEES